MEWWSAKRRISRNRSGEALMGGVLGPVRKVSRRVSRGEPFPGLTRQQLLDPGEGGLRGLLGAIRHDFPGVHDGAGEDASQTRLGNGLQRGHRALRPGVEEVVLADGGDAPLEVLQAPQQGSGQRMLRVQGFSDSVDPLQPRQKRHVLPDRPQEHLIEMGVGIDQAGHQHLPPAIDERPVPGFGGLAGLDPGDDAVRGAHVARSDDDPGTGHGKDRAPGNGNRLRVHRLLQRTQGRRIRRPCRVFNGLVES